MKHFVKLLVATVCVACTICAASVSQVSAAQTVDVTIPEFAILINGDKISNSYAKYPCIVYKDITYFPMTYNDSRALGLVADWTAEEGLVISKAESTPCDPDFEQGDDKNTCGIATVTAAKITVNGKIIDNSVEEYPILLFRNITYFPLTWRFAVEEFGWGYRFTSKIGLEITADERLLKNIVPENAPYNACGDNLTWEFNEQTGTLLIKGNGDMWDFLVFDESYDPVSPDPITPWTDFTGKIRSIYFDGNITSIGDGAFSWCTYITNITIPSSVISIGESAFNACCYVSSVVIPENIEIIGDNVFARCYALQSIEVEKDNKNYISKDGVLFSKDKTTLICFPTLKSGSEYEIPSGVISIGSYAFIGAYPSNVKIPGSVRTISCGAFYACDEFTNIIISDGVTSIQNYAFKNCDNLRIIEIPDSITTIANNAFENCNHLSEIHFAGTESQWSALGLEPDDINNAKVTFGK